MATTVITQGLGASQVILQGYGAAVSVGVPVRLGDLVLSARVGNGAAVVQHRESVREAQYGDIITGGIR